MNYDGAPKFKSSGMQVWPVQLCIGITVATSHSGEIACKAKLLVVADLPAKASLLNCNQLNGHYGCSTCLHEGRQVLISCTLVNYDTAHYIKLFTALYRSGKEGVHTVKTFGLL